MTLDIDWTAVSILNKSLRTKGNEVNRVANQKIINLNLKPKKQKNKKNLNPKTKSK